MQHFLHGLAVLAFSVAPLACASSSSSPRSQPESSSSVTDAVAGRATLACPLHVVCDASFDYHAFESPTGSSSHLYLSFAPSIVRGYSLDAFQTTFAFATASYEFDDGFRWGSREPIGKGNVTLTRYEGGVLTGHVDTTMTGRVEATSDACQERAGGDGPSPAECAHPLAHAIPIRIDFSLALPGPDVTVGDGS
jgi:hypothetical protein